jgi:hypothetical protein
MSGRLILLHKVSGWMEIALAREHSTAFVREAAGRQSNAQHAPAVNVFGSWLLSPYTLVLGGRPAIPVWLV